MSEPSLLFEQSRCVAWITLNRPGKLNALSADLIDRLNDVLDKIERDEECRCVVITGAGRAFCAGGDLKEFRSHLEAGKPEGLEAFVRKVSATFARLENMSQPVIGAVNGVAVAGGLELILCCDLVVAAKGAKMGDGHLNFGVLPGGGAAARLPRKIGQNLAAELLLTGESMSIEWWQRAGVVNRIVEAENLKSEVGALAQRIAGFSPLAVADMKSMTLASANISREQALAHELDIFAQHTKRADFLEGLRAFAERRGPNYQGR